MFKSTPEVSKGDWHRHMPLLPVRLNTGKLSGLNGAIWRRWDGKRWEYRQDAETYDEWLERQI